MFYSYVNKKIFYGRSLPALLQQLPDVPAFNHPYIQEVLIKGLWSYPMTLFETLFEGIYRVPLGYEFKVTEDGLPRIQRQWQLNTHDASIARLSFEEALDIFREKLLAAVQRTLCSNPAIAVELSGGLDSSSVAALCRTLLPQAAIYALSNGVAPHSKGQKRHYDESPWSRLVSKHLALEQYLITDGYHFHDVLEKYTEALASFSEVLFPLLNHRTYEIAHTLGVRTLLSGYGGDEVVSRHGYSIFLQELKQQKAYGSYALAKWRQKCTPLAWLKKFTLRSCSQGYPFPASHLAYLRIPTVEIPENMPPFKTTQASEQAFIEGALSIHWQRRIETSQIIARSYGIDCQFPLADPDLMQFFHQLPADYKFGQGYSRYLLRRSMEGMLPSKVVWRNCKEGATAPAASVYLRKNLPELFCSRITADHQGLMADYVNIPKLIQHIQSAKPLSQELLRLSMMVLMFAYLERHLKQVYPCQRMAKEARG